MNLQFQKSAKKDLKKLDKSLAIQILNQIKNLEQYPDLSNIKKLKNHYPPLRYRIGDYRVLFTVEDDEIIVIHVKHRKEAYS